MIFSQVTFFSALYNKIWITIYIILLEYNLVVLSNLMLLII